MSGSSNSSKSSKCQARSLACIGFIASIICMPGHAQQRVCNDQWPAWSPGEESIVFTSTRTGDHEIYTLNLPTGDIAQLTNVPGRDAHASFSPDGSQIAFQSPRGGTDTHIYTMKKDGSNLEQITHLAGFSGMPVWSPDGEQLAFQWRSRQSGAKWQLIIVELLDGSTTEITDGSANDQVVNWSPDGASLVFHSDRTGKNQIYSWKEGVTTRITATEFTDQSAAWSPDGQSIAFVSARDGLRGIYLMAVDGSDQRKASDIEIEHGLPFFSPDGSRLLLTPTGPSGVEIWILEIETGLAEKVPATCSSPA